MPVPLPIDHPVPLQIATIHGLYGTVRVVHDGHLVEGPVQYGALHVLPSYQGLVDRSAAELLPSGAVVSGQLSALRDGLPVIDVMLGSDTVAETWIRSGWALPDEALYADGLRHSQYSAALATARKDHAGIWGEEGVSAKALGLSAGLDHRTQPPAPIDHVGLLAAIAVLVLGVLAGWRERWWRQHQLATRPPTAAPGGVIRRIGRGALTMTEAYFGAFFGKAPGLFRAVPPLPLPVADTPADQHPSGHAAETP